jgi:UDP:flavonoid glycosyltransferase YjiC (YdhE family)
VPGPDQYLAAEGVVAAGAGLSLPASQTDAAAIKTAAATILTEDAAREGARRLSAEMLATSAPADVVGTLEKLV